MTSEQTSMIEFVRAITGARRRATDRATVAMTAYWHEHDEGRDAELRDLLADLMHWAASRCIDFDHEIENARDFFAKETEL